MLIRKQPTIYIRKCRLSSDYHLSYMDHDQLAWYQVLETAQSKPFANDVYRISDKYVIETFHDVQKCLHPPHTNKIQDEHKEH